MKNLHGKDGAVVVDQRLRRAAIRLMADDDEATPQAAAVGRELETTRHTVGAILLAIWVQCVQQRAVP